MRYWAIKDNDEEIVCVEKYSHDLDVANRAEISKSNFDQFIASLPKPPPPIDWKAEWLKADTQAKKISVLAGKLGLEPKV